MSTTMQAMVCEVAGRPLALRTLPRPTRAGEVQLPWAPAGAAPTIIDGELADR
jgi:hypothetical protein